MKLLTTLTFLLISSLSYGQGIWNPVNGNSKFWRLKADSVLIVPRDTSATNNAFYLGATVGDSGRLAHFHGRFWGRDNTKFRSFAFLDEIPSISGFVQYSDTANMLLPYLRKADTTSMLLPYLRKENAAQNILLSGLLTALPEPIQPTNTLLEALARLQAQTSYQYGTFFKYNEVNAGALWIKNPLAGRSIVIQKSGLGLSGDTTSAVLGWRTTGGRDIGYIGIAKNIPNDTNSIDLFNGVGRTIITSSDTTATIFATWTGAAQNHYTFFKAGKWRMYNTAPTSIWNDPAHHSTLEIKGSFAPNIRTVSVSTAVNDEDGTIVVNNTGSATVSLPAAAGVTGRIHTIVKISSGPGNDLIIDPNGAELINGVSSKTLTLQWSSITIQSNGVSWIILSSHANATVL